jgi:2'-5' RNA ligase
MAGDSSLIRCFVAIDFPDEVVKEIARVQGVLGRKVFQGKMTEVENLHLTLKFLGEISEEKVLEVREKLREIEFKEFNGKLMGAGTFNIRGNPRIAWIKVGGSGNKGSQSRKLSNGKKVSDEGVFELQKKIDEKLSEIGFKKEERFMSHLTIARIKYVKDKKGFIEYVKGMGVKEIGFKINGFKLFKSELKPAGPVYEVIERHGKERE